MKIAVVADKIDTMPFEKNTTIALMRAVQDMGFELFFMTQEDLYIKNNSPMAYTQKIKILNDAKCWFKFLTDKIATELLKFDIILMRKDPPVDKKFIHTLYILELAERAGVYVANSPKIMYKYNEKIFALSFPELIPNTVVSCNRDILEKFLKKYKKIILKPLDNMGGTDVFLINYEDGDARAIFASQTSNFTYPVMVQEFIPEITKGDKRVVIINGKVFPYGLVRTPKENSIIASLSAGGVGRVEKLTNTDMKIAQIVAKKLKQEQIMLAGIDIIGGKLIEINITNAGCLVGISEYSKQNLPQMLIEEIIKDIQK